MDWLTGATVFQAAATMVGIVFTVVNILVLSEIKGLRSDVRTLFTSGAANEARLTNLERDHVECRRERLATEQRLFEKVDGLRG